MIYIPVVFVLIVTWFIRRAVQRALRIKRGFDANVQASKLHMLDPSDQMKAFLTERDLVTPTRAYDEAYGSEEDDAKESAAIDKAIARALQKKATTDVAPQAVMASANGFGRRRAS